MANPGRNRAAGPLALLLAYALAGASWGLASTPLGPEEAKDILIGREALAAGAPACPTGDGARGDLAAAMCAWPGAVLLAPAAAAWADSRGGLAGARLSVALAGLLLILLLHRIGEAPAWGRRGLLVAATFVLLGVPLQLFATAHPRVLSALLGGLSVALAQELPAPGARRPASLLVAALAGASLALAVMASYVAVLFALPLAAAVAASLASGRRDRGAAAAFVIALAGALAVYAWVAVRPAWPEIRAGLAPFRPDGWALPPGTLARVLDGLAMPFLLATFALFHRDGGRRAAAAMAIAGAAFLVPFLSPAAEDAQTAKLLAFVALAPAAGVGVARMSEIFAMGNPSTRARPLFAGAVLVVVAVFGVHEMRTLRRERPDLSAAVSFLREDGAAGRTVLVESDSGSPEYVYRYYLAAASPPARIVPVAAADPARRRDALRATRPDFVVLDEHHSERSFRAASREYLGQGFTIAATYRMPLASGPRTVQILRRAAP
jgi:hypothetical protein